MKGNKRQNDMVRCTICGRFLSEIHVCTNTPNGTFCVICEKELTGTRQLFCSDYCRNYSEPAKNARHKYKKSAKGKQSAGKYRETHKFQRILYNREYRQRPNSKKLAKELMQQKRRTKKYIDAYRTYLKSEDRKEVLYKYNHSEKGRLKLRADKLKRRHKDKDVDGHIVKMLLDAFRYCVYCESTVNLTIDHINPHMDSNQLDNLTVACRSCNGQKCERDWKEWYDYLMRTYRPLPKNLIKIMNGEIKVTIEKKEE